MPTPVSRTTSSADLPIVRSMHSNRDASFESEFEGVRQEVEDDLFPHVAVDRHALRQRFAFDFQLQSGLLRGGMKIGRELGRKTRQVGRLEIGIRASGFDTGKIKQRVHQLEQPL